MSDDEVSAAIDAMKSELGVELDRELAKALSISPTAVAAWRSRKTIPSKYKLRFSRKRDEQMDYPVSGRFGRLRDAYIFCLVEAVSERLRQDFAMSIAPTEYAEAWRGFRLADAYSYFQDMLPTSGDKDSLRAQYEAVRREVDTDDFLVWLETLGS